MTTISHYEIVCAFNNTKSLNKPTYKNKNSKASNNIICKGPNVMVLGGDHFVPFMAINPIQTNGRADTPVFEVYTDGTKRKISTKHFFGSMVSESWVELKVDIHDDNLEDELWEEDLTERVNSISLIVKATSIEEFNESFDLGYSKANSTGKIIRHMEFKGEYRYNKFTINSNPVKLKALPKFMSEDEYEEAHPVVSKPSAKAAKSAVSAPILADELSKFEEECEVIEVPAEASNVDEVNALFGEPTDPSALMW